MDKVKVWDGPVRLFHWLLVVLIGFSWWSGEQHEMEWHRWSGYTVLGLIVFRLFWGFAGSRTARFAQFLRGPGAVASYVATLPTRDGDHSADGHNPLGGWSVAAMLLAIAAMVTAGLFAVDVDGFESGPLASLVTFDQGRLAAEWHEIIFNVIMALVAIHVLAVLFYLIWKRQNLIPPMITGYRPHTFGETAAPVTYPLSRLLLGIGLAALVVWAVVEGFWI
jgi:cytochrome b